MKDNRGITLVELIVSIAIFSIVAAILAGITGMILKFYSSEKMDSGMQYEGQMALNAIMDSVMQTQGIAIVNGDVTVTDLNGNSVTRNVTKGLFLGKFTFSSGKCYFTGKAVFGNYEANVAALYVEQYTDFEGTDTVNGTMTKMADEFFLKSADYQKSHLLAERVSSMLVEPSSGSISTGDVSSGGPFFYNPFSVDITIVMEARTQKGIETQKVTDRVMVRNTLDVVYYGDESYGNNE